jgi:hypothetical protein
LIPCVGQTVFLSEHYYPPRFGAILMEIKTPKVKLARLRARTAAATQRHNCQQEISPMQCGDGNVV